LKDQQFRGTAKFISLKTDLDRAEFSGGIAIQDTGLHEFFKEYFVSEYDTSFERAPRLGDYALLEFLLDY